MSNIIALKREEPRKVFSVHISALSSAYDYQVIWDYLKVFLDETDLWPFLPKQDLKDNIESMNKKIGREALRKEYRNVCG